MASILVTITVSDPWDVGEAVRWQPIRGELSQPQAGEQDRKALVKFESPINYHGMVYRYAVASPRRKENLLSELYDGRMVCCVFTGISDEQVEAKDTLDISKWRGGLGFDGDVQPVRGLD